MSKRTTTRSYIGAWVIFLIAFVALLMSARSAGAAGSTAPTLGMVAGYVVMGVTGIVMLVTWIVALIKLGMERAWGWVVALVLLHLFGLGIVGMVAYAVGGPEDEDLVVTRPATPV